MSVNTSDMKPGAILQSYEGSTYAYKLVERQHFYVNGEGVYYWVYLSGKIQDNKFVGDKGKDVLTMSESDGLRSSFEVVWTPEATFKEGDLLVTTTGQVVMVGEKTGWGEVRMFWYLGKDQKGWDKKEDVERKHGKLSKVKSNLGDTFTGAKRVTNNV